MVIGAGGGADDWWIKITGEQASAAIIRSMLGAGSGSRVGWRAAGAGGGGG